MAEINPIYGIKPGWLVQCDLAMGTKKGGVSPEISKTRPAVVVSRQLPDRDYMATVVPLSTVPPREPMGWHVELDTRNFPSQLTRQHTWAKCDLIMAVSHARLSLYPAGRDNRGKRMYFRERISRSDLSKIREAILAGLSLDYLKEHVKNAW